MITIQCPKCGTSKKTNPGNVGNNTLCSRCGQNFTVPQPSASTPSVGTSAATDFRRPRAPAVAKPIANLLDSAEFHRLADDTLPDETVPDEATDGVYRAETVTSIPPPLPPKPRLPPQPQFTPPAASAAAAVPSAIPHAAVPPADTSHSNSVSLSQRAAAWWNAPAPFTRIQGAILIALSVIAIATQLITWLVPLDLQPQWVYVPAWEYKIESPSDLSFESSMNVEGISGWELVSARRAAGRNDDFKYEVILKRSTGGTWRRTSKGQ